MNPFEMLMNAVVWIAYLVPIVLIVLLGLWIDKKVSRFREQPLAPRPSDDVHRLNFIESHGLEIALDPSEGEGAWCVYRLTGGPNDREWHKLGRGRTLREAIDQAVSYRFQSQPELNMSQTTPTHSVFTCPKCGGHKFGTSMHGRSPDEWTGRCHSDNWCKFSWPRRDDHLYFTKNEIPLVPKKPNPMAFTKKPPAQSGYYLWRQSSMFIPEVVRVNGPRRIFERCGSQCLFPIDNGDWWPEPIRLPTQSDADELSVYTDRDARIDGARARREAAQKSAATK